MAKITKMEYVVGKVKKLIGNMTTSRDVDERCLSDKIMKINGVQNFFWITRSNYAYVKIMVKGKWSEYIG